VTDPLPDGPPLARSGVDRAAHYRGDPQWLADAWPRARVLVIDLRGRVLCALAQEGAPDQAVAASGAPSAAAGRPHLVFVDPVDAPEGERLFLGLDDEQAPYFAVVAELPPHPSARAVTLREVGAALSDRDAGLLTTAASLANWHATHRYSPGTGEPTSVRDGGWLRVDPRGQQLFPRTDPAVIVLVHDAVAGAAGRCLLGHNAVWRRPGRRRRFFSTLAGFVEPGESAEAAVVREIQEEVGVRVTRLRYEGSQAWPFPGSLMLGFTGYADPAQPVRPDLTEIAEARWFTRTEVAALLSQVPDPAGAPHGMPPPDSEVALPGPASIAHYLIRTWLDRSLG
jgi:NAD+ diphosphatase